MARPTYLSVLTTDTDVNSPQDEDLMDALRANSAAVRIQLLFNDVAEYSHAGGWTAGPTSLWIEIPDIADYTGIQRLLSITLDARVSLGTGQYRLHDVASATDGTTSNNIIATAYGTDVAICTLDIDASWVGTVREIVIESQQVSTGTVYYKIDKRHDGYLEY